MKVAIIEDERPAAEKLTLLLGRLDRSIEVLTVLSSVLDAVKWLDEHQDEVDLIFMDIQLLDGKSFQIFSEVRIVKPIIFLTAYEEYSLEAFKVSSIDYLLKPITLPALETSLSKFDNLVKQLSSNTELGPVEPNSNFKDRFMVKFGDHIRSVSTNEIVYFLADGRNVYLHTRNKSKYIIDYKLEELEGILNPQSFFRVNRSFILQLDYIKDVLIYSNSRLKVITDPEPIKEIIVSRDKVAFFKEWFGG